CTVIGPGARLDQYSLDLCQLRLLLKRKIVAIPPTGSTREDQQQGDRRDERALRHEAPPLVFSPHMAVPAPASRGQGVRDAGIVRSAARLRLTDGAVVG